MRAESEAVRIDPVASDATADDAAADGGGAVIPASVIPASAVPASAVPASAVPASAIPASVIPAVRPAATTPPAVCREPPVPMTDDCPELPRIHALADGELPAREAARARDHLAVCEECRAELAFLMQLALAVARGVAPIDEMDAFSAMAVLSAVRAIGPPS